MRVIRKAIMKDGTHIQIEDWSENYSFVKFADTIAAYPTVRGERLRAEKRFDSAEATSKAFEKLLNGASLETFGFTKKKAGRDVPYTE